MSENQSQIIFLFGAGASIPAGLSGIMELTTTFENEKIEGKTKDAYYFLKEVLEKANGQEVDIENILQQLNEFVYGPRETSRLFYTEQDKRVKEFQEEYLTLIKLIKKHLREKLEVEYNTNYLLGLKGFIEYFGATDIFSLNYDSVIETFCEHQEIRYTDGFELYWNPDEFKKDYKLKLFKLHGSLYWFKTENGKLIKIPAKNLDPEGIKFYSDELISETMVYPSIIKELELNPYSFLRNQFISKLSKAKLLVVIGYSFRDKGWQNIVTDQLIENNNLWILITDINPEQVKSKLTSNCLYFSDRIIGLPIDSGNAFSSRILNDTIKQTYNVMLDEQNYMKYISNYSDPRWNELRKIIKSYKELNHLERAKSLIRKLLGINFQQPLEVIPNLTNEFFVNSLNFSIDCIIKQDWKMAEVWLQILAFRLLDTENQFATSLDRWSRGTLARHIDNFEDELKIKHFTMVGAAHENDLMSLIDIDNKILNLIETKTRENIMELIRRIKMMVEKNRRDCALAYNRGYKDKAMGIIFPLIEIMRNVSEKVPRAESFLNDWNIAIIPPEIN